MKSGKINFENSPTAWFCTLESARNKGDFEQAAEAVRELKRLGVTVKFKGVAAKKLAEAERALTKHPKPVSSLKRKLGTVL